MISEVNLYTRYCHFVWHFIIQETGTCRCTLGAFTHTSLLRFGSRSKNRSFLRPFIHGTKLPSLEKQITSVCIRARANQRRLARSEIRVIRLRQQLTERTPDVYIIRCALWDRPNRFSIRDRIHTHSARQTIAIILKNRKKYCELDRDRARESS